MPHDVRVSRSPNKRRTTNIEEPAMPRFMGFVRMEEGIGQPPQALMDAMGVYITEQASAGHFLDGGGLNGPEDAVNFVVRAGETTRVEGPYAKAKAIVGGWPLLDYATHAGSGEAKHQIRT